MFYFVLVLLIAITGAVVFFGGLVAAKDAEAHGNRNSSGKFVAFVGLGLALGLILILTVYKSFTVVDPGNIGIKKSFGKLTGVTDNGTIMHNPWTSVKAISVQNTLRTYDMTADNSAITADSQPVFMLVQVNYQILPAKAVDLYQSTGGQFVDRVLDPNVFQLTKATTAQYTATQFGLNRDAIRAKIERALSDAVRPQGIQINNVSLKNVQFTPALQQAIERTVEATQNAKREEAQVRVVQAQAQQKVAQAKGEAEATLTQARADAQSQRLKQRTLTPLLVQMAAIDKLNPNVSVIVCNQGQACIPNAVLATAGK